MRLFIIPSWYPTRLHPESGSFFADRARMLQTNGHEVTVITAHIHSLRHYFRFKRLKQQHFNPENENGLITYRFETVNPWPLIQRRFYHYYRRQLLCVWDLAVAERGKPDAVVVNSSLWAGTALADRLYQEKIPFIVSEHLKEFIAPNGFTPLQRECILNTYQKTARIVATSNALKTGVIQHFPEYTNKIQIIPNPVDTNFFVPNPNPVTENLIFNFAVIALLRPEKKIDLLIKTFSDLLQERPACQLTIAGNGPERKALWALIQKLNLTDRVKLVGYQSPTGVRELLHKSQALILPSTVETFGVALIEAMACGLPVLATRCGGPEDIVTPETGLLVEKNNRFALMRGMVDLIERKNQFNSRKIREYAVRQFGVKTFTDKYTELLSGII